MPLTVCPLSNVRLRVVDSLAHHPLAAMLAAGLRASVHSDDPAYFGGGILAAHAESAAALGLSGRQVHRLLRNGLEAAFWGAAEAAPHLERLDGMFGV